MRLKGIEVAHLELAQAACNNNALMTNGVHRGAGLREEGLGDGGRSRGRRWRRR